MDREMPQVAFSYVGSRPPSSTQFLWTTQVRTPGSISIGSAVVVGLTVVSNGHTRCTQTTEQGNKSVLSIVLRLST